MIVRVTDTVDERQGVHVSDERWRWWRWWTEFSCVRAMLLVRIALPLRAGGIFVRSQHSGYGSSSRRERKAIGLCGVYSNSSQLGLCDIA